MMNFMSVVKSAVNETKEAAAATASQVSSVLTATPVRSNTTTTNITTPHSSTKRTPRNDKSKKSGKKNRGTPYLVGEDATSIPREELLHLSMKLSKRLKHFGQSLGGREQLAVEEFASALEFIPLTLAENAGMDPIDVLTELKSKHNAGDMNAGLNLFENKVDNVLNAKIIEPYKIKSQAIASATEVAIMILRIDDVIASADSKSGKMNYAGSKGYQGMD